MASLVTNPSAQEIKDFCDGLAMTMLRATAQGHDVVINQTPEFGDVTDPEYGDTIIDKIYVGCEYRVQVRARN